MTDYSKRIDAKTWAFIERTNSFYPPDAVDHTVEQQRETYDRMARAFFAGYPDGVSAADSTIAAKGRDIPIRTYRSDTPNPSAMVVYYHGGGFILGGLESHDDVCADLCAKTGFELVSVDYRLSPEHVHPAAFDDAIAAFEWAATTYDRPIVVCGDSAGGNLAASVAHKARSGPVQPIGQMLIYPGLGGDMTKGSYLVHAEAPMLTTRDLVFYGDIRTGGRDFGRDPTLAPLHDTDFAGLPPTMIITAACDPLSSDGEAYRDHVLAAGGKAHWREEPGLVHSFMRGRKTVSRAGQAFERIAEGIAALGKGEWPSAGTISL